MLLRTKLKFTPLEFETDVINLDEGLSSELKFTPLEFETRLIPSFFLSPSPS